MPRPASATAAPCTISESATRRSSRSPRPSVPFGAMRKQPNADPNSLSTRRRAIFARRRRLNPISADKSGAARGIERRAARCCGAADDRRLSGVGPARSADRLRRGYAAHDDGVQGAGRGQSADDAGGDRLSRRRRGCTTTCSSPRSCRPRSPAARATSASGGAFLVSTGRHTGRSPKDKFVVREPSVEAAVWWENNAPMAPDALRGAARRHARAHHGRRALRAGSLCRRRPGLPAQRAGHHRARLARPLHPPPAAPPGRGTSSPASSPGFTILNCPSFQADPARHGCRSETVIAISFEQRLILIGGTAYAGENKKCGLHRAQLPPARAGGDADALLGQPRRRRPRTTSRCSSASPAPARPRSRPIPARVLIGDDEHGWSDERHLQLRGRLLRQDHQPLRRGRAGDLRDDQPLRHHRREHGLRPGDPRARLRRRQPDREHPLRLSARGDLERLARPPAAASRRTS